MGAQHKDDLEFSGEIADQIGGRPDHPLKHISDWNKLNPPTFLKRYLNYDICVCIECRGRFSENDLEHFYAFFCKTPGVRFPEANDPDTLFIGPGPDLGTDLGGSLDHNQEPVFIRDVHFVHGDEKIVVRRGLTERLVFADELFGGICDALYTSVLNSDRPFFRRLADGKPMMISEGSAILQDERSNQVIETGAEMMDNLTRQNGKAQRRERLSAHYESILSAIRLELSNNGIWFRVAIEEGGGFAFEIQNVFVGPLNFGPMPA